MDSWAASRRKQGTWKDPEETLDIILLPGVVGCLTSGYLQVQRLQLVWAWDPLTSEAAGGASLQRQGQGSPCLRAHEPPASSFRHQPKLIDTQPLLLSAPAPHSAAHHSSLIPPAPSAGDTTSSLYSLAWTLHSNCFRARPPRPSSITPLQGRQAGSAHTNT